MIILVKQKQALKCKRSNQSINIALKQLLEIKTPSIWGICSMIYKNESTETTLTIILKGSLTFSDYGNFGQVLDILSKNKEKQCIIDLEALDHIDSAGLGMIILCKERFDSNKRILLKNAKGHVAKMLELGRFNEIFDIHFINN